jgi:hypothetical protein
VLAAADVVDVVRRLVEEETGAVVLALVVVLEKMIEDEDA